VDRPGAGTSPTGRRRPGVGQPPPYATRPTIGRSDPRPGHMRKFAYDPRGRHRRAYAPAGSTGQIGPQLAESGRSTTPDRALGEPPATVPAHRPAAGPPLPGGA